MKSYEHEIIITQIKTKPMIMKYSNVKKSFKNLLIRILPPSLIANEGEIVNNIKNNLMTSVYSELSDEEWLKAKNRILDGRTEYRNLMESLNNANTH